MEENPDQLASQPSTADTPVPPAPSEIEQPTATLTPPPEQLAKGETAPSEVVEEADGQAEPKIAPVEQPAESPTASALPDTTNQASPSEPAPNQSSGPLLPNPIPQMPNAKRKNWRRLREEPTIDKPNQAPPANDTDPLPPAEEADPSIVTFGPAKSAPKQQKNDNPLDWYELVTTQFLGKHPEYDVHPRTDASFKIHQKGSPDKIAFVVKPDRVDVHSKNYADIKAAVKLAATLHKGDFIVHNATPEVEAMVAKALAELQKENALKHYNGDPMPSVKAQVANPEDGALRPLQKPPSPTAGSTNTIPRRAAASASVTP